jgi:hypothetical protein
MGHFSFTMIRGIELISLMIAKKAAVTVPAALLCCET